MSNHPKQRLTLTDLREPQQLRELNRQLSWIWDRLLGGLNLKSLDAGTRQIIEDKASRSEVAQTAEEISLTVERIRVGGTQLIPGTKTFSTSMGWTRGTGGTVYTNSAGAWPEHARLQQARTGAAEWTTVARTPLIKLPDDWQGRELTLSAYIGSPDWTAVDKGITWVLCLSDGSTTRGFTHGKYSIVMPGRAQFGSDAQYDSPLENGKLCRAWTRFVMSEDQFAKQAAADYDFADCTHMFIQFWLRRNGTVRMVAPKLEWGNKATDWTPAPEDPAEAVQAGSKVTIREDMVSISTPEFSVDIPTEDGGETMLRIDKNGVYAPGIDCPNVAPRYDGPKTLYVDPDATASQVAAGNYFRSLTDVAERLNNRWVDGSVTVNLTGDVDDESVTFRGIHGGTDITLTGTSASHANLNGRLNLYYNDIRFRVNYLDIDAMSYGAVVIGRMQHAEFTSCIVRNAGTSGSGFGFAVYGGAYCRVEACEVYDFMRGLRAYEGGVIVGYSNKGNCTVGVSEGTMHLRGTQPCADTTWTSVAAAGEVYTYNVTVDQGSKPTAPTVTTTTVSYSMTHADNYVGSGWTNYSDEDIRQGYTDLGEHRGCFWFDNETIRAALTGKTVRKATLSLYQMSGVGRNQPVQVNLEGIVMEYDGRSGVPYGNPEYGVIGTTLGVNQTTTFTVPVDVVNDLVAGTINGLMVRTGETEVMTGDDNSYHFARFAGGTTTEYRPVLTVTYA